MFYFNANKVFEDTFSCARIQATNAYLRSVSQPVVEGEQGCVAIYLSKDQYKEVMHLRVIVFRFSYIAKLSTTSLQYVCAGNGSMDGNSVRGL